MSSLSPWVIFENDLQPAQLLLKIHRLFQHSEPKDLGTLLGNIKAAVNAEANETIILIWNELFVGLIRERARCFQADFREPALSLLLRPAIVFSCTAMETFLVALLREYLPRVIKEKKWGFYPMGDATVTNYFDGIDFSIADIARLMGTPQEAPLFVINKMLKKAEFQYLGSKKGIHVVGALLGLDKPWAEVASHLGSEKDRLQDDIEDIFQRRNDIVHRADRPSDPNDTSDRHIKYSWANQAIGSVTSVSRALFELVEGKWKGIEP